MPSRGSRARACGQVSPRPGLASRGGPPPAYTPPPPPPPAAGTGHCPFSAGIAVALPAASSPRPEPGTRGGQGPALRSSPRTACPAFPPRPGNPPLPADLVLVRSGAARRAEAAFGEAAPSCPWVAHHSGQRGRRPSSQSQGRAAVRVTRRASTRQLSPPASILPFLEVLPLTFQNLEGREVQ